jgi:hypothetical protein
MRVGGQRHAPAALTPGNRPGTHCIGDCVGHQGRSGPIHDISSTKPEGLWSTTFWKGLYCEGEWSFNWTRMDRVIAHGGEVHILRFCNLERPGRPQSWLPICGQHHRQHAKPHFPLVKSRAYLRGIKLCSFRVRCRTCMEAAHVFCISQHSETERIGDEVKE